MAVEGNDTTRKYSSLLALITVIAMLILTFMWFWFKDYPFNFWPQRFRVSFHQVAGLTKNGSVLINGVHVGSVENLELKGPHEVLVSVRIKKSHVVVPEGSKFTIRENGFMGPKCLDIYLPEKMDARKSLNETSMVYGIDPPTVSVVDRLGNKLDSLDPAEIHESFRHMSVAADRLSDLSSKLVPAASRATLVEDNISLLANDLRGVSHRVNHLLGDRHSRGDLAATSQKAKEAAEHFDDAMARLQQIVADKPARDDIEHIMNEFDDSAQNIQLATAHLTQFGTDTELRSDAKQIVSDARKTVENISDLVKKPAFGAEAHSTLTTARRFLKKMNLVATQLHQILDKRAPMLQILFKRPGHLQPGNVAGQEQQFE